MHRATAILILGSLIVLLSLSVNAAYLQAYKPPIQAKPGDVATGAVVRQGTRTLILNTTPCDREQQIVIFRSPYETKPAAPKTCANGTTLQQITVSQK